jgi:hypothetical protein
MSWSVFKLAWAKNGTPDETTGDTLTISDLTATTFNVMLLHTPRSSTSSTGNIDQELTLDNNTNTDYAFRVSNNGGADATTTSTSNVELPDYGANGQDMFQVAYIINISGEEKLGISFWVGYNNAGATSAPERDEAVWKVDTTTNSGQFTRIDINNSGTDDFSSPVLAMLGTD